MGDGSAEFPYDLVSESSSSSEQTSSSDSGTSSSSEASPKLQAGAGADDVVIDIDDDRATTTSTSVGSVADHVADHVADQIEADAAADSNLWDWAPACALGPAQVDLETGGAGAGGLQLGVEASLGALRAALDEHEEATRQRLEALERSLFREMDFVRTMLRRIRFGQTAATEGGDVQRRSADARFFELVRRKFLGSWEDSFMDVLSLQPYQMVFLANLLDLPAIRATGDRPTSAGLFPPDEEEGAQ